MTRNSDIAPTSSQPQAHLVQSDIVWEDRAANREAMATLLRSHAQSGTIRPGDLVVLTEMFDTGFSFRLDVTADRDNATLDFLCAMARELRITLQGSRSVIGPDGKGRNQAPIIGPDGHVLCMFDKMHPFSIGRESKFFTGGDRIMTYDWVANSTTIRVCPTICYDLRFPELFRLGMLAGAELFALGASWPGTRAWHRRALGIARAIENQAYLLFVNRAGSDPHLTYDGASYTADHQGTIVGELSDRAGVLSVSVDIKSLRDWRAKFPVWKDIRLISPIA